MKTWYNIKKNALAAEIYVYDEIGIWGVSAKDFIEELNSLGTVENIDLHVNSPGGSVVDVVAMMTALKSHNATVTAYVDGLAASSASRLIMAADVVEMADNALLMIHNVWTYTIGNANELRKEAELLDKFDDGLANDYAKFSGKEVEEIKGWMAEDTWFSAEEAKEAGLITRIGDEQKAAASVSKNFHDKATSLRNCPDKLPVQLKQKEESKTEPKENLSELQETDFKPTPPTAVEIRQAQRERESITK